MKKQIIITFFIPNSMIAENIDYKDFKNKPLLIDSLSLEPPIGFIKALKQKSNGLSIKVEMGKNYRLDTIYRTDTNELIYCLLHKK